MYYSGSLLANGSKFSTKLITIYDENSSIKYTANHRQLVIMEPYLKLFTKILQILLPSHKPEC